MLEVNDIARPLVGAVIGYSTNWLAIKMLFKPHEAKYIGKFRIPFTPGLIPKERERIAGSLGTAVGEKLLTEEVISKELLDERIISHIKSFVVSGLLDQDLSIRDIMEKILGDDYAMIVSKIAKDISSYASERLKDDSFKTAIGSGIRSFLSERYPHNTRLETLLPESTFYELNELLFSHKDSISQFIINESRQESVVIRLKQVVSQLLMEKVGALGAMFVNPDDIAASILDYAEQTVKEEEVQRALIDSLLKGVEQSGSLVLSEVIPIGQYDAIMTGAERYASAAVADITAKLDLQPMIDEAVNHFLEQKIHLTRVQKEQIEAQVEQLYVNFVKANIGTFLETFELKAIVESEVNAFSVGDIEKLIFTIVDKELKAITWFGALLGFIMGLVMIVL